MSKNAVQGYQILKIIGKGAFAIVYQAQNIKTKEIVAVKQITIDQGESPHKEKLMELFKTEIKIMQKMKHQNILELKEVQYSPDCINMVIEYCSQGDLEKFIKKHALKNRLSEEEGKPIILQIVEGMKILRLNNVVHRDLKLANILINEQMQIKLADFGFAKFSETEMMESYCGTPITMAPEILKKVDFYDCKCDIWSLGVMIYQILFGAPPFIPLKGTVTDLLIAIQKQKLNFPQHIPVSNECKDLLRKMLVEDPQKRMSFEELFRHPWAIIDRDILDKSVLQVNQPQHTQFLNDLQFTLVQKQKEINEYVRKIIEEMNKFSELAGLGVRLLNHTSSIFKQFKLNIKYSNKFVIIENQQHFKRIDFQEEILLFLIDLYEYGINHNVYDLSPIFQLVDIPQNVTNVLTIQYEDYTSNLEQELKTFKINNNNKNNGKLLQICNDTPQYKILDIQIIISLANDRYAL